MDSTHSHLALYFAAFRHSNMIGVEGAAEQFERIVTRSQSNTADRSLPFFWRRWVLMILGSLAGLVVASLLVMPWHQVGLTTSQRCKGVRSASSPQDESRLIVGDSVPDFDTAQSATPPDSGKPRRSSPDQVTVDTVFSRARGSDRPAYSTFGPVEMQGVRALELTPDELRAIGYVSEPGGISTFTVRNPGTWSHSFYGESISSWSRDTTPPTDWPAPTDMQRPTLITVGRGGLSVMDYDEEALAPAEAALLREPNHSREERDAALRTMSGKMRAWLAEVLPTLIAVRVPNSPSNITLWFLPQSRFVSRLPANIRRQVERELKITQMLASGTQPEDIPNPGEPPILDAVRSFSGAVAGIRGAGDERSVRLRLTSSRTVNAVLYGMSGERIAEIAHQRRLPAGTHDISIQGVTIPAGVYLVGISTDRGEHATGRVTLVIDDDK